MRYSNVVEFIGEALASVSGTAREVVALLYGFDGPRHPSEEITQLCGLSLHQIEQTAKKVIRRMRHPACARIIREALISADEQIWRSMAGAVGIVYKSRTDVRALLPGELFFAIECQYGSVENWLSANARATAKGWYRSRFPETEIERIATKLAAQADEFQLPLPLEWLAREMQVEAHALETVVRLSSGHRLYSGYVAGMPLGTHAPRAVRLHRILSGVHAGEVVPSRRLVAWYRSEFTDDACTLIDAEIVLASFPHLFLRSGDLGWCGIGAAGNQEPALDGSADADVTFFRWSEERKSRQEATDPDMVRHILEEHGPLRKRQIQRLVQKQSNGAIPASSVSVYLTTCDEFLRLAPGVYGLYGQPAGASQLTAACRLLLNRRDCLQYMLASWAGEPADAYPLWTPDMEADWCEWAQAREKNLLGSLLSVVDPLSWPVPYSYQTMWQWKKECLEHFKYEKPARYPLAGFPLIDLLALLKCARWRGSANWLMANRVTGNSILTRSSASLMAFLVGVGAVFPASHWQKPHATSPDACGIDGMLSAELHRKGSLAWDGDSGRSLLDRLAQSIDRGETGWAPRPELQRLLGLLRDTGHS